VVFIQPRSVAGLFLAGIKMDTVIYQGVEFELFPRLNGLNDLFYKNGRVYQKRVEKIRWLGYVLCEWFGERKCERSQNGGGKGWL
jgi:hypothetical protein